MIPIRDIKPNVTIIDYWFIGCVGLIFILFIIFVLFLYKKLKKKNTKKEILKKLQNLNFNDPKKTAYEFTFLIRHFLNDDNKKEYEKIIKNLEKYKYKKEVPPMSKEDIESIKNFIKEIRV